METKKHFVVTSDNVAPRWQGQKGEFVRTLHYGMAPYCFVGTINGIELVFRSDEVTMLDEN